MATSCCGTSTPCCASNSSNNNNGSTGAILQSVQEHYARYISAAAAGDDSGTSSVTAAGAKKVLLGNRDGLEGLGYTDPAFLARCGFDDKNKNTKQRELLDAVLESSCGSGCPLRRLLLLHDKDTTGVVLQQLPDSAVIVDLGCGTGHDVLLAGGMLLQSGAGRVIGVDATEEMLAAAERHVAAFWKAHDCEKKVQIDLICDAIDCPTQHLEMAGLLSPNTADVVISNGVFNLTRDKPAAFATAYWLLKPGGTLLLADVCRCVDDDPPPPDAFFSPCDSSSSSASSSSWSA